jgi:hypothetical protein
VDAPARKGVLPCQNPRLVALPRMVVNPCFAPAVVADCPPHAVAQESHPAWMLALMTDRKVVPMVDSKVAQKEDQKVVQPALEAESESEQAHPPAGRSAQALSHWEPQERWPQGEAQREPLCFQQEPLP